MSKLRDHRTEAQTEERNKKLSKAGMNCYYTEGISRKFLEELEKFSTHYFFKYGVKGDLDWWLDQSRDKVIDRLMQVYDPSKGPLVPFVTSCLRNKATNISRREGKKVSDDSYGLDGGSQEINAQSSIIGSQESRVLVEDDLHLHAFQIRASRLALSVDIQQIVNNTREGIFVPMATAYAWLRLKGEV